ncbi:MAG TPA: aldehyde dehydrogenase family protein, partial [Anaerolineae bacterium]
MSMTDTALCRILERQRAFYRTGATRDIAFRKRQLNALLDMVRKNENAILDALHADLNKPRFEAYGSEVGLLRAEIKNTLRQLSRWAKPRRAPVHITQLPSTTWIYPEPYGVALIIAPWNYPFLLIIAPLVGAMAAGNCAILKPSELAPATSALTAKLIAETFD